MGDISSIGLRNETKGTKKLLKEMTRKKISYLLSKHTIKDTDVYTVIKEFFKEYLSANYEFTFDELTEELKKTYIEKPVKDKLFSLIDRFSKIEYQDEEIPQEVLNDVLKEFNQIVEHLVHEEKKKGILGRFFAKEKPPAAPTKIKQEPQPAKEPKPEAQPVTPVVTAPPEMQEPKSEEETPAADKPHFIEEAASPDVQEEHDTGWHDEEQTKEMDRFPWSNDTGVEFKRTKQSSFAEDEPHATDMTTDSGFTAEPKPAKEETPKEESSFTAEPEPIKKEDTGSYVFTGQTPEPETTPAQQPTTPPAETPELAPVKQEPQPALASMPQVEEELPEHEKRMREQGIADLRTIAKQLDEVIKDEDLLPQKSADDMETLIRTAKQLVKDKQIIEAKNTYKELLGRYDELKEDNKHQFYDDIQEIYRLLSA